MLPDLFGLENLDRGPEARQLASSPAKARPLADLSSTSTRPSGPAGPIRTCCRIPSGLSRCGQATRCSSPRRHPPLVDAARDHFLRLGQGEALGAMTSSSVSSSDRTRSTRKVRRLCRCRPLGTGSIPSQRARAAGRSCSSASRPRLCSRPRPDGPAPQLVARRRQREDPPAQRRYDRISSHGRG